RKECAAVPCDQGPLGSPRFFVIQAVSPSLLSSSSCVAAAVLLPPFQHRLRICSSRRPRCSTAVANRRCHRNSSNSLNCVASVPLLSRRHCSVGLQPSPVSS
ncbi:hypothetical protein HN51_066616, partial [Arachis hypogaea]